ncbi:hypothetical protein [Phenylobacterium sp.]|uniref:hypothetical protein n=1 Tax=Phenylobacterium sp. TaxID=1871053 RepID=UPI0035B12045
MRSLLLIGACVLAMPVQAMAQDNQCKARQDEIGAVAAKYKAAYEGYAKEGEEIKADAATFNFDVDWADTEIIFDLPTTTVKDQRMVFGVPQTTVRQQDIIFDTPSVRMKRVVVGQHPEVTCKDTWIKVGWVKTKGPPSCTVTWHNNYMDVPEPFMQRQRIVMGVPEFTWANTEVIMGVPEFRMDRQRWVVGLPQFKLTSVALNKDKIEDRSTELQNDVAETREHQRAELVEATHALFACNRDVVVANRKSVENQFGLGLSQLDGAISTLRSQGADPSNVVGADGKAADLLAKRSELHGAMQKALADFDKALADLGGSEREAVDKMKA